MSGISIESMTGASYLLYAISGVLGVSAVVMFFLFDIKKCWRMTLRKQKTCRTTAPENAQTERLSGYPTETVLLYNEVEPEQGQIRETVLLDSLE